MSASSRGIKGAAGGGDSCHSPGRKIYRVGDMESDSLGSLYKCVLEHMEPESGWVEEAWVKTSGGSGGGGGRKGGGGGDGGGGGLGSAAAAELAQARAELRQRDKRIEALELESYSFKVKVAENLANAHSSVTCKDVAATLQRKIAATPTPKGFVASRPWAAGEQGSARVTLEPSGGGDSCLSPGRKIYRVGDMESDSLGSLYKCVLDHMVPESGWVEEAWVKTSGGSGGGGGRNGGGGRRVGARGGTEPLSCGGSAERSQPRPAAADPRASSQPLLIASETALASLFACTTSLRRLQLQQRLYAAITCPGAERDLLAVAEAPALQARLRADSAAAFSAWQEASRQTALACLDANLAPAAFTALAEARGAAHQRATRALAAYKVGLLRTHELALLATPGAPYYPRNPSTEAAAATHLHSLIEEHEALFVAAAAPAEGPARIASITDAQSALAPSDGDRAAALVLANASATELATVASTAAAASSSAPRISATLYLVSLARAAVAPLQPPTPDAAEQQRALHHQELADLEERERALQQQGALTARADALAAAWPQLQDAERAARLAAKKATREVEDLQDDGRAPSAELLARCEEKLARQTAALAACEGAREGARALAAADCPDALRLLRAMHPPPPPAAHATELDRMWAELEDAGVALPFRRADYIDSAQVARAHANVFSARLRGCEERVVLKEFSALGADLRLFCNEARLLRRLAHPNILALGGVLRSGTHLYLQLPYVEGGSLREWLAGGGPAALPRTPAQCVRAFCGTMAALAYVHSCGVVHRDLKPDNILMHLDGSPRLADFGISIAAAGGGTTLATAASFHGAGTEDYKAPEQLRGERASPASDVYAAGLVLHEIVFRRPYALPVEARRRGAADTPALIPPASAAAEGWPEGLVEAARALLARLLAPAASDRPVANAVLADLFCERSSELLAGGEAAGGGAAGGQGAGEASALARTQQALAALVRTARRVPAVGAIDLPRGDTLLPTAAAALAEHLMAVAPTQPPRLVLTLGGEADPERALDALLAAALRPALRLFGTAAPYDDEGAGEAAGSGPVLPLAPRGGREAKHAASLFAVGAALAQAALQGCTELNTLARLPPLAYAVIARGTGAALAALASLPSALAALATFDADKARTLRSVLAGRAADFALELPNWQGVEEAVTDANKATLVQRECERLLVRSRAAAWEALHAGFLGGGGRAVVAAMDAAALACLRGLVYDAGKSERRRAALGSIGSADAAFIAAHTRPCPNAACRAACTKDSGCMHVRCGACGTAWNWCCGTVEAGHPARSCPRGGDVGVRLQI